MPTFRTGTVTEILSERRGLQRVLVDGEKAFVLTQLTGDVAVGDEVVLLGRQGDEVIGPEEWGTRSDTIGYEIVTDIAPRRRRVRHLVVGG